MAHVKLTLRPPPNVDFVIGYPGIPPGGPERPQASVKGAIEVRVAQQGVKAKWVRIELRKVETLPGGGVANTFYDFVGPSPVNLWTSSDEYGLLRTQDFPFSIRIPESIPPSIALENNAGIQYELVASVCTKGKKGFLRRRKSVVSSAQAGIVIDKHELHSTWPVYNQPESRNIVHEGITLIVDRTQACYGPGDRISVMATVKSDSLNALILRGFDISLRETTAFRAGHYSSKKSAPPQPRSVNISENKLPVNTTMYGGTQHKAELSCVISADHTTTSLNTARHIDVTYVLCIKALIDTMVPIIMELPVVVSNWQRIVSYEAIRRIGPTPNLSLLPINSHGQPIRVEAAPKSPGLTATLPISRSQRPDIDPPHGVGRNPSANAYNTLPAQNTQYQGGHAEGLGYGAGLGFSAKPTHSQSNSVISNSNTDELSSRAAVSVATNNNPTNITTNTNVGRRPNSATATNRFTITNTFPGEIPQQETPSRDRSGSGGGASPTSRNWMSAEEEKRRLYEEARAKVEQVQGNVARVITPPPTVIVPTPMPASKPAATDSVSNNDTWPPAEEEKARLFYQAQAKAAKTQGLESYSPPSLLHGRSNSIEQGPLTNLSRASSSKAPPASKTKPRTAAEIYSQAMSARNDFTAKQQQSNLRSGTAPKTSPKVPVPQYRTAEEEKAALRRYEQAKEAVDRVQNNGYSSDEGHTKTSSDPIAYESLYPHDRGASSSSPAPPSDMPPPFEAPASVIPASHVSEKEKLRRAYEQQDAAAAAARQNNTSYASPPPFSPEPFNNNQVLSEKERLRRKFEAQDPESFPGSTYASPPQPPPRGLSSSSTSPPTPPPRSTSSATRTPSATSRTQRPTPAPPSSSGRIMTAAEEKALLRAQYAAEDARAAKPRVNGHGPGRPESSSAQSPPASPHAPPPLMPRPPVEYIQETQEEDARVSRFVGTGNLPPLSGDELHGAPSPPLDMTPFTPFSAGFESSSAKIPGPPPPLPPKPEGE